MADVVHSMAFLVMVVILLLAPVVEVVVGQTGFLNINCGLDDKYSGYNDVATGLVYVSDGRYVDAGENHKVAPEYESQLHRRYLTVRTFPSGLRNCYTLPTVAGAKYLLRMEVVYANHDGRNSTSLEFDLHLGPNFWITVDVSSLNEVYEAVFVAWASWAPACLVNTGGGTPFVSVVELRQLAPALYPPVTIGQSISKYDRRHMASNYRIIRFPLDSYDRYWWWIGDDTRWTNMSTTRAVEPDPSFMEPLSVLQTAITAAGNDTTLAYGWQDYNTMLSFIVFLHFADFQNSQTRQFDIYFNGNRLGSSEKPYSPQYLTASCVYSSGWYRATDGSRFNITLTARGTSMLPPMLNGIEIYTLIAHDSPWTFPSDFEAIIAIKLEYGVKKNWMGDPCFPIKYAWDGVKCSNTNGNTTRITSLDLSNSSLQGVISKNFSLLTALENLDLSYNSLSGSIPDSVPSLPSLRVLNLSGNHLSEESLCKNYTGVLVLRYESEGHKCNEPIISPSRNRTAVTAISVVVPVLVVVVLLLAYFIWREKRKTNVSTHDHLRYLSPHGPVCNPQFDNPGGHLQNTENRRFTYKELEKFTDNFKRFIGQGGFGLVYYGCLENGTEVAVKMCSESSSHGLDQFLAEVQSLTKVHHKNLVSLVGYCLEKYHLALVYEYMSQGSLSDHLRGKNGAVQTLSWGTRLRVVLEAAQGLDYLHKDCNMPIVHRDVKTSNILLGQNLQAKIADFGLSKTYVSDTQTHISTSGAGTPGYIDPEYYQTGRLTESSDVYSFGVVLLEVVTGELPILSGHGHIVHRVKQKIATGDLSSVADSRFRGAYDANSVWKVVETAMMCTADDTAQRPAMASVVIQLKECLALEEARQKGSGVRASPGSDDIIADLVPTSGPLAR